MRVNGYSFAQMIDRMIDGTHTCDQIAAETGLHYVTVLRYARELHRAGAAHICDWETDVRGRYTRKVYRIGRGKDVKRPVMKESERARLYRVRQKQIAENRMFAGR